MAKLLQMLDKSNPLEAGRRYTQESERQAIAQLKKDELDDIAHEKRKAKVDASKNNLANMIMSAGAAYFTGGGSLLAAGAGALSAPKGTEIKPVESGIGGASTGVGMKTTGMTDPGQLLTTMQGGGREAVQAVRNVGTMLKPMMDPSVSSVDALRSLEMPDKKVAPKNTMNWTTIETADGIYKYNKSTGELGEKVGKSTAQVAHTDKRISSKKDEMKKVRGDAIKYAEQYVQDNKDDIMSELDLKDMSQKEINATINRRKDAEAKKYQKYVAKGWEEYSAPGMEYRSNLFAPPQLTEKINAMINDLVRMPTQEEIDFLAKKAGI